LRIKPTAEAEKLQHPLRLRAGKTVRASFGDRHQTKLGGAPLLLQLELRQQLVSGAASCLRDRRVPSQIKYSLYQLLWQRVLLTHLFPIFDVKFGCFPVVARVGMHYGNG
jgi:hypothetical protein